MTFISSCGKRRTSTIKSNTRGDSGLSDSGFQRSQRFFLKKHTDSLDKLEKDAIIDSMKRRYEKGARPQRRENTIWQTIKGWLNVK
jgi:hypothetical protein|tara:strand:- start:1798 stop:2055 length:258 start_codon:yes stop_codon:yes gene_type:complete